MTLPSDVPATLFGHDVLDVLGSGAIARVLLARSPSGDEVALKRLHPHLRGAPHARDRLLNEAKQLERVAGPGVVALDRLLDDGRELCLSLSLVRGRSVAHDLDVAARGGPAIDTTSAARIARETLEVLARLHALGVVHGDVNPRNVMRTDGGVVLVDLGFAGEPSRATGGATIGTLAYLGPEQVDGTRLPASDVYAVGVMLWEMLRLERFHPPLPAAALLSRIAAGPDRPVDPGRPDLAPLRQLVAALLEPTPDARPTAREAAARLRTFG